MITQSQLPEYNHLVIIGNGFDLNLGLQTSYSHFVASDEFQSLLHPNLQNFFGLLNDIHSIQNWIDLENEIKNITPRYASDKAQLKNEFTTLKIAFSKYLTRNLNEYKLDSTSKAYKFINELNFDDSIIVNFNYTNVIRQFMIEKQVTDADNRIIQIHGDYKENNLILGVEDGAKLFDGQEFLLKSAHLNFTGFNLKRLIQNITKLSIFGHSLGETDKMYFEGFFQEYSENKSADYLNLDLYYYDENSYDSLMSRINVMTNGNIGRFRQNINLKLISSAS